MRLQCPLCSAEFDFGPHKYDGRTLKRYGGVTVCGTCIATNQDGWAPHLEQRLLALPEVLTTPSRNENGLLPRE
jgi:hypothetical protein